MIRWLETHSRFVLTLAVTGVIIAVILTSIQRAGYILRNWNGREWNVTSIEQVLGVQFPSDAQDLHFEGHQGRGGYLELTFSASSSGMNTFMGNLCDNVFFSGYDPFNTIDRGEPFTFAHRISVEQFPYYSYSLNTPNTIAGNRCQTDRPGHRLQVRVDRSNASAYVARIHLFFTCQVCEPVYPPTVQPFPEFPAMLLGLQAENGGYSLPFGEICYGVGLYSRYSRDQWQDLEGGTLKVLFDGNLAFSAIVSENRLLSIRDSNHNNVELHHGNAPEYYCFEPRLEVGPHQLSVEITTLSGLIHQYSWDFQLLDASPAPVSVSQ
ncbi:MAG: hypothetical protein J0M33_22080 [Anaerolineae bacterium]|nr:hypothetical protein [Anaerolineae bacterium]